MPNPPEYTALDDEATFVGNYPTAPSSARHPVLVVLEGEDLRRVHVIDRQRSVLGRGHDCDIPLTDTACSRRHAAVLRLPDDPDSLWVEDLGSTNGTFVNAESVRGRRRLAEHDKIRIGATLFAYHLRDDIELDADRRLIQLATVDPLTGLMNRGAFDEALDREFDRASRYGRPLSLILLDLDHFKRVNDTWGHPVGDRVLAQVSVSIRSCMRHVDIAARHGGEEFAVLLTETDEEGAMVAAERIRHAINALQMAVGEAPVRVTTSVGVVTLDATHTTAAALIEAADKTLYKAKNAGRNRTLVWRV